MGVEFAILAGPSGGIDGDLLEFDEATGEGSPAGDAPIGIVRADPKDAPSEGRWEGWSAEVAVLEQELAVIGRVEQGGGALPEGREAGGMVTGGGAWRSGSIGGGGGRFGFEPT